MKGRLNLQTLKRSGKEKELKICKKARRIISNGGVKDNLTEFEIVELAKKYPTFVLYMP